MCTVADTFRVGNGPTAIAFFTRQQPDPIGSLIAELQALVAAGSLSADQATGLIDKLEQIRNKMDNGQTGAACNQLASFINQVNALTRNGSLTASQGQALIDAANNTKGIVGC